MTTPRRNTVLVLGAHNRQVLAIIGSLHDAGYRVLLGRGGTPSIAEKSRFTDEVWPHAPIGRGGDEQFLDGLHRLVADRDDLGYIYPTDDPEAALLARNAAALPPGVTVVSPSPTAVLSCQDKVVAIAIAAKLGIPLAPYRVVENRSELADAARAIGTPFVVKPTRPLGRVHGRKALICWEDAFVDIFFSSWPEGHQQLIVQKYVRGLRTNFTFAARDGEILCAIQQDTVRTNMADGTGLACESMTVELDPSLLDHIGRLAEDLRYTGIGLAQFMVADDGDDVSFLELNPRFGGGSALPYFVGFDFPRIGIALAEGLQIKSSDMGLEYPIGRIMSSIHLDLSGLVAAIRYREIGFLDAANWLYRALVTFIRAEADMTWSWRDPMPGLYALTLPFRRRRRTASS
jgi:glutathione synthase/RimK-type ligase-like ATP-grasp enzyme